MLMEYTRTIPEYAQKQMSDYLHDKADGYLKVSLYGKSYYVPLTKDMKKVFKIKRSKDKLDIDRKMGDMFEGIIRIIIDSIYLQIRNTVGAEISEEIKTVVQDRINDLLVPQIDSEIEKRFAKKENLLTSGD